MTVIGPLLSLATAFNSTCGGLAGTQSCVRAGRSASPRWSALARRLPCDARTRGPTANSLRALQALRSDSAVESVDEARCARGHEPCASRHLRGAPRPARTHLCSTPVGLLDEKD